MKSLTSLTIIGNILCVVWIIYNGMDDGFSTSPVRILSYLGIIALLILNAILLSKKKK